MSVVQVKTANNARNCVEAAAKMIGFYLYRWGTPKGRAVALKLKNAKCIETHETTPPPTIEKGDTLVFYVPDELINADWPAESYEVFRVKNKIGGNCPDDLPDSKCLTPRCNRRADDSCKVCVKRENICHHWAHCVDDLPNSGCGKWEHREECDDECTKWK